MEEIMKVVTIYFTVGTNTTINMTDEEWGRFYDWLFADGNTPHRYFEPDGTNVYILKQNIWMATVKQVR
jgi:hypothetical protein